MDTKYFMKYNRLFKMENNRVYQFDLIPTNNSLEMWSRVVKKGNSIPQEWAWRDLGSATFVYGIIEHADKIHPMKVKETMNRIVMLEELKK